MTRVLDDPVDFKAELIDGFAAAYARYAHRVPGASGFIRSAGRRADKVSLLVGGGSGHFPSYAGLVGTGLADGCVLGDVFTSPSSEQIYRVGRAVHAGPGLVLGFGNYAGDRLNFAAAQQRLLEEGIDTRIVFVTDDVASAPTTERERRRGIAGTFAVYKIAGAAAERGDSLDEVERLMRAANDATFSFGVAFSGCTLPGRAEPLFTVEPGRMEFGLGIHGEPGILSSELLSAHDIATKLVDSLLAERPPGAPGRVAVIVNGLGATSYEELYVLYGHVHRLLSRSGVAIVRPEVGEFVTSLDMAGCSLSITWLDGELEECWLAEADTASFRRGRGRSDDDAVPQEDATVADGGTAAGLETGGASDAVRRALRAMRGAIVENEDLLARLDGVAGDGDHGSGMRRGITAAVDAADRASGGPGSVLTAAGLAFGDRAGGTSGVLWGILLTTVGAALGDEEPVTSERVNAAVRRGTEMLQSVGKASLGDKTMMDALIPFANSLDVELNSKTSLAEAWATAATVSRSSAESTAELIALVGRARPLAERSLGHPDPGAVSMAIAVEAIGSVIASEIDTSDHRSER